MQPPDYADYPRANYGSGIFPPDRIWGTIFIVLYTLMLLFFLAVVLLIGGGITLAAVGSSARHGGLPFAGLVGPAIAGIAMIILVPTIGIHIVGAVGIHRSRAWGFWLTIILSVISLLGSSGGTCLTLLPMIYSIVRLSGGYGPKPV